MSVSQFWDRHSSGDRNYWLCRCEGFAVEKPGEHLGVVEWVRFESRQDRPDDLVVRGGLFGRKFLRVPVDAVDRIDPAEQRIILKGSGGVRRPTEL